MYAGLLVWELWTLLFSCFVVIPLCFSFYVRACLCWLHGKSAWLLCLFMKYELLVLDLVLSAREYLSVRVRKSLNLEYLG